MVPKHDCAPEARALPVGWLKFPDDLDASLRHEAARHGLTISQLTREAWEHYLQAAADQRRLMAAGAGRSGRSDVSERIEGVLAE